MSERVDVADRMRALAAARWIDRSDEATRGALTEGAAEIERLQRALATTEARLSSALHACGDAAAQRAEVRGAIAAAARYEGMFQRMVQPALATLRERDALRVALADAQALARGAQYREREALAVVARSSSGPRGVYERGGRRVWWSRVAAGGASE